MKKFGSAAAWVVAALILAPGHSIAQSVPNALVYTGFLSYSASGAALNGEVDVELALHMTDTPDAGDPAIWTSPTPISVDVQNGVLSLVMEGGAPVTVEDAVLAGAVWLQVSIDGTALSPRQEIVSVPFALRAAAADYAETAADADSVGGIDSTEVVTNSALSSLGLATESYVDSQGFAAAADLADYLPRDGSAPMTGAMDLGGQNLVNGGTAQFAGNVATPAPVASDHAANKGYVDAIVATAASSSSSTGGGRECYYARQTTECMSGFQRAPGEYTNSGASHIICCTAVGGTGFFVLTETSYTGNLGGLTGANALCLTELQSKNWLGKTQATLSSDTVRAFLCDDSTCQDPLGNSQYRFAAAGSVGDGGESFQTDFYGRGPGDSEAWHAGEEEFGASEFWWSGYRGQDSDQYWGVVEPSQNNANDFNCGNWTTNGANGRYGYTSQTGSERWNFSETGCSNPRRLICLVDPVVE